MTTLIGLSAVVGRGAVQLLPALDQAVAAGVLGEAGELLAFRHDLIREAIFEDLPLAVRKALHGDAGRALAATGAPVQQVATQLALGASPGDVEAVAWLRRAAQEVALRWPASAAELLERAGALADDDAHRDDILVELAPLLIQVGRGAEVVGLARRALAASPDPAIEVALRRALEEAFWVQGRMAAAAHELEAAAAVTGGPDAERAGALALAGNATFFLGQLHAACGAAERARAEGERVADDVAVCQALQTLTLVAHARGYVAEAVELGQGAVAVAGRLRHPRVGLYPHFYLGLALLDADWLADAETTLRKADAWPRSAV